MCRLRVGPKFVRLALAAWILSFAPFVKILYGQAAPELTTVQAVRKLSPEQAAKGLPVRLRGVVTVLSGYNSAFFLEDATGGTPVDPAIGSAELQPGQWVEVRGVTVPGKFAPSVNAGSVKVLGKRPLPPSRLFQFSELFGGGKDGQWIAIQGIVRAAAVKPKWQRSILFLDVDIGEGNLVTVYVHKYSDKSWDQLVGSTVTIRGVCGTIFNDKRQYIGLRMFIQDLTYVHVVRPAPADPFAIPLRDFGSFLEYGDRGRTTERTKIRGVVTYNQPDKGIYVQNGLRGVFVTAGQASSVPLGSEVEVLGYPAVGGYSPAMSNAVLRVVGAAPPVIPRAVSAAGMIVVVEDGSSIAPFDSVLVKLQGRLLEDIPAANEELLLLRDGKLIFTAVLPRSDQRHETLKPGSMLRVTGICAANVDEAHDARSFEILLRSFADIAVIEKASWWTVSHAEWIVASLMIVILIMSAWIVVSRRQARLRTMTVTDDLTGLFNRRGFFLLTDHHWRVALRNGDSFLLFFIDVDDFKRINDQFGHDEGDRALQEFADLLRECFRRTDIVARIGGDEFAVSTDFISQDAREMMEDRLAAIVQKRNERPDQGYELSLSVGVLVCDNSLRDMSVADLLGKADRLMYEEKSAKKSQDPRDEDIPFQMLDR